MNFEEPRFSNMQRPVGLSPSDERFKASLYDNDQENISYTNAKNPSPTGSLCQVDPSNGKFPYCIVWTPIPLLTWLLPFLGHMGIAYSTGVIRDFAGSYYVSEDDMAFGSPTKYWQLDPKKAHPPGAAAWDTAIMEASNVYTTRVHNLCADNCHSHVAMALNRMTYNNSSKWNMITLCFLTLWHSKYVSVGGIFRSWGPFILICLVGFSYMKFVAA